MKNYFITGTDTGVGKTHVTALLLAELRRQGIRAAAMKPIACGRDGRRDAERYAALMNHEQPLDVLNPVFLRHPLAPSVAANLERRRIDLRQIQSVFRLLSSVYRPVLVEGAGGLLVPISSRCHSERSEESLTSVRRNSRDSSQARNDKDYFIADLARDLGLPVIIVARLGLGTINHTLLTVRQAQATGLTVAGIILNDTTGRRGVAERTNIQVIPELTGVPLLGVVPHGRSGKAACLICRRLGFHRS
jgi:dethiobiotin synthetase